MLVVLAGLIAGALHVIAGPDHLAALLPIALSDRRRAVRIGATWGLGHGIGVLMLGALGIATRELIDLERVSAWSELAVGFILIAIGLWSLRKASRVVVHDHDHDHDHDELGQHRHPHVHVNQTEHAPAHHSKHTHAAFGIGMLHGSAGVGHVFGVLPSLALPPVQAAIYLVCYLVAAVASMAAFGLFLKTIAKSSNPRRLRFLMNGAGVLAITIGVVWIFTGVAST